MKPFRLLTIAAFAAAIVPRLAHKGMFVDGVTYAAIARNLAIGRGSFWAPAYTATIYPEFHDHPPFGFWLQSLWFRLLGDHLFVERAYTVTVAVLTALLITVVWRRLTRESSTFKYEWLPVLLWLVMPVVSWSIVGNLLDTTMCFFTTAAVAAVVYAELASSAAASGFWGALSGVCVVAAVLTKGPVGFFPLAAPVILAPLTSSWGRRTTGLAGQWLTVGACAAALFGSGTARANLELYLHLQVLAALTGRREMSGSSLTILKELVQGVALPIAILSGLCLAIARRFVRPSREHAVWATSLLLVALAGTLPILASTKQAGHYLVPALPLYAIAAAGLLASTVAVAVERTRASAIGGLSALLVVVTLVAAFSPGVGRDRRRMATLDAIDGAIPRGATLGICPESNGDWGLHAWFERRFDVSLDARGGQQREWFLQAAGNPSQCVPPTCQPVTDRTRELIVLKCGRPETR